MTNKNNAISEEELFIQNQLNKQRYKERRTVASENNTAPGMYDFDNINDALYWVKMIGAETNSPNGIELVLSDGIHILKENDVLGNGMPIPGVLDDGENPLLYLRDINLTITGSGSRKTKIKIENKNLNHLVFENMNFSTEALTIAVTGHLSTEFQKLIFIGSEAHLNATGFVDVGVLATMGSTVRMSGRGGSAGMCSSFTTENLFIEANMNSYIHITGIDFGEKDREINVLKRSYIFMEYNFGDEFLKYNTPKNKLSNDMSLIYDHNALGVYTSNLKYIVHDDYAEIQNSAGTGFDIPVVTDNNFGFMTPDQKMKLDNIRPYGEDSCDQTMQMWNGDADHDQQTVFIISGFSAEYTKVYCNGVLVRNSEYRMTKNYEEMILEFKTPRKFADWIAVEYML